ncbi:hypothetical protein GW17_00007623 [Ensete ventricosum]|nr:hypothetical protein GW17_00007623 [Ensete ventricosum]
MSQERPQNNANRERLREEAPTAPQVLDIEGPSFLPPPGEGNPFALTPNHYCYHPAHPSSGTIHDTPTPDAFDSTTRSAHPTGGASHHTLSSDSADSLMAQLRQVNRRLDEVQKEFVKSKEALGESSMGGSPFALEIQDKPIPPSF